MFTTKIQLKLNKLNRKGEAPIYFRIIKNRKITYISSGISINPKYWDGNKSRVKKIHSDSEIINNFLLQKEKDIIENLIKNYTFESRKIKQVLFGKHSINLFEFSQSIIEDYRSRGFRKSIVIEKTIQLLKEFNKSNVLYFNEIDLEFLIKFKLFLKAKNYSETTVSNYLSYLKLVLKKAMQEKVIHYSNNPFVYFKIGRGKFKERLFLIQEELDALIKLNLTNSDEILVRDLFIFGCYCGGIRFSDILSLKNKNFDGSHISFISRKTTTQQRIKVPSIGIEIINRYKQNENENTFIFPIFNDSIDLENEELFQNKRLESNMKINKQLKLILEKAGIHKYITFHCSRHTFATLALSKSISIEKVSKILGHSSVSTTQIYAKILNKDVDKAMDLFN